MLNYLRRLKEKNFESQEAVTKGDRKLHSLEDDFEPKYGLMLEMDFVEDKYKAIAGKRWLNI